MWGAITFGIGTALVILEIYVAAKKKGGIEAQDWKRIRGLIWLTICATGGVMALIWLA